MEFSGWPKAWDHLWSVCGRGVAENQEENRISLPPLSGLDGNYVLHKGYGLQFENNLFFFFFMKIQSQVLLPHNLLRLVDKQHFCWAG